MIMSRSPDSSSPLLLSLLSKTADKWWCSLWLLFWWRREVCLDLVLSLEFTLEATVAKILLRGWSSSNLKSFCALLIFPRAPWPCLCLCPCREVGVEVMALVSSRSSSFCHSVMGFPGPETRKLEEGEGLWEYRLLFLALAWALATLPKWANDSPMGNGKKEGDSTLDSTSRDVCGVLRLQISTEGGLTMGSDPVSKF